MLTRHLLFSDPEKSNPQLSPDGKQLSYLAPCQEGVLGLWLTPFLASSKAFSLTQHSDPIHAYTWSLKSDFILYLVDHQGDENWQLFSYECATKKTHCYSEKGVQVKILGKSALFPHKILITSNERDKHYFDVYEVDLLTKEKKMRYQNDRYWDFIVDNALQIRMGMVTQEGGYYLDFETGKRVQVTSHDLRMLYFYPQLRPRFTENNVELIFTQSCDSDSTQLCVYNFTKEACLTLSENKVADVLEIVWDPVTQWPIAYAVYFERKEWVVLSEALKGDFDFLQAFDKGELRILSQSVENDEWLVAFSHDNAPTIYAHYVRSKRKITVLFVDRPQLNEVRLAHMQPVILHTTDGLQCVNYLSLPVDCAINQEGYPTTPLPLVLLVHGGPHCRDFWGFNPFHQWLTYCGYAVLSVNFRSSSGFGKRHADAGNGEWAGKIHQDLIEAVHWAIQVGIAQKEKVAIMGKSFGGYCALVGMTMTPEVFCCGVDIVGPANLATMLQFLPPYWKTKKPLIEETIGIAFEAPEKAAYLEARSPIHFAKNIRNPLFIVHGANDARIMVNESEMMVKTMQANKVPVTYVVFSNEGHHLLRPENRIACYELIEAFFSSNLKGGFHKEAKQVSNALCLKVDDFNLKSIMI